MKKDPSGAVQSENRRLAAIMFTDIVGFSRQMGSNETRTLRLLDTHNQIIRKSVTEHHGTVIKTVGDAFLIDFPSVVHAVQCAQDIQAQFRVHNAEQEPAEQIHVRVGIHLGDIVQREGDVFGDGVNIASRLQELAEPDSICISDVVYRDVAKKLDVSAVVSLGQTKLKNIDQRFPVYMLVPEPADGVRQTQRTWGLHLSRRRGVVPWMAAALLLVAGAVIAARYLFLPPSSTQSPAPGTQAALAALPLPDKPSIVVLPFVNMSSDPGQEYFSDGVTEELTTNLSRLSDLFVISRNSAFFYKGKAVKMPDLSKELGVKYVLEGSVRKAGDQVRITAQLIDATTDYHLWSERYDRPLQDIFAVQDEIARKIVTTLNLQFTLWGQGVLVTKRTDNLEAYDFYLRGVESFLRAVNETQQEANAQARQLFEKAIALDPQYAAAYAQLSSTYFLDLFYLWNPTPQVVEQMSELARKAIVLDDSLSAGHATLSYAYLSQRQHEQAIAEAERAIALNPNLANNYWNLAAILTYAGRPQDAIESIQKAMRLNPRHRPAYFVTLAFALREAGRCEEAIAASQRAVPLIPNSLYLHWNLIVCYVELGREEEARAEAAEIMRLVPNFSLEHFKQALLFKDPAMLEHDLAAVRKAGLK